MPGILTNTIPNRPIRSNLRSRRLIWEEEHPIRWSYMKLLREYSTLKREYPVNPYAEVYQMRNNLYAIFTESLDGCGDPWMYLIDGPEKAMLIDTSFGVGDLKGLCRELVGDKPLLVANTHHHYDHAYGNPQFDACYCYEDEVYCMEQVNRPDIWDYLFDAQGHPLYAEFDRADIIPYHPYHIIGVPANYRFDLGQGYQVELVPLTGHTAGQCGYLDLTGHTLFIGDITGIGAPKPGEPHPENCTVEAQRDCMAALWARHDEFDGVFPGHGMLDQTNVVIRYHLDALEAVLKDPENCNEKKTFLRNGQLVRLYQKYIYQGTALRYSPDRVYRSQAFNV